MTSDKDGVMGKSFKFFPYPPDYKDGRDNNGGIDLVLEPSRISEITELAKSDALRDFVVRMNSDASPYLTMGCDFELRGDGAHGYVDFTTRSFSRIEYVGLSNLPSSFAQWLEAERGLSPEILAQYVTWEIDWVQHRTRDAGDAQRLKLMFYYNGRPAEDAEEVLKSLQAFLFSGDYPEQ